MKNQHVKLRSNIVQGGVIMIAHNAKITLSTDIVQLFLSCELFWTSSCSEYHISTHVYGLIMYSLRMDVPFIFCPIVNALSKQKSGTTTIRTPLSLIFITTEKKEDCATCNNLHQLFSLKNYLLTRLRQRSLRLQICKWCVIWICSCHCCMILRFFPPSFLLSSAANNSSLWRVIDWVNL